MGSILNTHGLGTIPDNTTGGPEALLKRDDAPVGRSERRRSGEPPPNTGLVSLLLLQHPAKLLILETNTCLNIQNTVTEKNTPRESHVIFFSKTDKWKHFKENSWDCWVTGQLLCRVTFGLGMSEKQMFISGYRGVRVHLFPELNPDHHRKERLIL